jgi:AmmeMemoRadiSam system protein A
MFDSSETAAASVYTAFEQRMLVEIPVRAIAAGVDREERPPLNEECLTASLTDIRAAFVTLRIDGELRGCCGSLQAFEPLHRNVARSGCSAAFSDPRFSPVERAEVSRLSLHVSVLSPSVPIAFDSEAELLEQLRPGIDGVILSEGKRQAVFLPSVWEHFSDSPSFLSHLKRKAGLSTNYWSPSMAALRFTCASIHGEAADVL